jgi:hypothetical protein
MRQVNAQVWNMPMRRPTAQYERVATPASVADGWGPCCVQRPAGARRTVPEVKGAHDAQEAESFRHRDQDERDRTEHVHEDLRRHVDLFFADSGRAAAGQWVGRPRPMS